MSVPHHKYSSKKQNKKKTAWQSDDCDTSLFNAVGISVGYYVAITFHKFPARCTAGKQQNHKETVSFGI